MIIVPALCTIPVFMGFFFLFRWRRLLRTNTLPISDLKEGIAEVKGELTPIPGQELLAPITNFPCVMYETAVYYEEYEEINERSEKVERTRWSDRRGDIFLVRDATGSVRVNPKGVNFEMETVFHESLEPFGRPSKMVEDFCARKGIDFEGIFGIMNRPFHFRERIMRSGKEVFIHGYAEKDVMDPHSLLSGIVSQYLLKKKGDMLISFEGEKLEIKKSKALGIGLIIFGNSMILLSIAFYFIGKIM